MKTLIQFLLATFTILACVCCKTAKEEKTDDKLNEITFADPTIFVENGKYYLTGTRNREPNGFAIFESTDLKEWTIYRVGGCQCSMFISRICQIIPISFLK